VQGGRVHEGLETGKFDGAQAHTVDPRNMTPFGALKKRLCQRVAPGATRWNS